MSDKRVRAKLSFTKSVLSTRNSFEVLPKIPRYLSYRGREELVAIPSHPTMMGKSETGVKERKVYTGSALKGIGVMHKSNLVPVFDEEEAIDLARMRR